MGRTNCEPLKLSGAERQKLYRARRNADPEKREKYLMKEKERWKRDVQTGRKKLIGQKTKTEQHIQRIKWKEASRRRRSKRAAQREPEEEALRQVSVPLETLDDSLSVSSLCNLVRWAHSHGTICNLIPNLQQLTHGPHGADGPVAMMWGCSAGHAYYWTPSDHGNVCGGLANTLQGQVSVRGSCVQPTSEMVDFNCQRSFDTTVDFSATDDSEAFEQSPGLEVKRIKEEFVENDASYLDANRRLADLSQDFKIFNTQTLSPNSEHNNPQDKNSPMNHLQPVYT